MPSGCNAIPIAYISCPAQVLSITPGVRSFCWKTRANWAVASITDKMGRQNKKILRKVIIEKYGVGVMKKVAVEE